MGWLQKNEKYLQGLQNHCSYRNILILLFTSNSSVTLNLFRDRKGLKTHHNMTLEQLKEQARRHEEADRMENWVEKVEIEYINLESGLKIFRFILGERIIEHQTSTVDENPLLLLQKAAKALSEYDTVYRVVLGNETDCKEMTFLRKEGRSYIRMSYQDDYLGLNNFRVYLDFLVFKETVSNPIIKCQ